jgi:hypothetical protein
VPGPALPEVGAGKPCGVDGGRHEVGPPGSSIEFPIDEAAAGADGPRLDAPFCDAAARVESALCRMLSLFQQVKSLENARPVIFAAHTRRPTVSGRRSMALAARTAHRGAGSPAWMLRGRAAAAPVRLAAPLARQRPRGSGRPAVSAAAAAPPGDQGAGWWRPGSPRAAAGRQQPAAGGGPQQQQGGSTSFGSHPLPLSPAGSMASVGSMHSEDSEFLWAGYSGAARRAPLGGWLLFVREPFRCGDGEGRGWRRRRWGRLGQRVRPPRPHDGPAPGARERSGLAAMRWLPGGGPHRQRASFQGSGAAV